MKTYENKTSHPDNIYVLLGDHKLDDANDGQEYFNISKIIVHPDFVYLKDNILQNDIALLKLAKPTKINAKIGKVCLPKPTGICTE